MSNPPLIILATGGTGGHVFPAEAVAQWLLLKGYNVAVITDKRVKIDISQAPTERLYRHIRISAAGVAGKGFWRKLIGFATLGLGYLAAHFWLLRLRPAAVVGFGGYSSLPTMLASIHQRKVTLIHEQNAVMGRANRLLASQVKKIALSFEKTEGMVNIASDKISVTGNPVRPQFRKVRLGASQNYHAPQADEKFHLLITGGSQGARVFSKLVPQSIELLDKDLRSRLSITQQARAEDVTSLTNYYQELGIKPVISSFFTNLPQLMAEAHLLIGRAGASTIAELLALGRPSILIPYPHAIDNHQAANAARLSDEAAAWVQPESAVNPAWLAARLERAMRDRLMLEATAAAARRLGGKDSAELLGQQIIQSITFDAA